MNYESNNTDSVLLLTKEISASKLLTLIFKINTFMICC